jgi:hypothetical protein
MTQTAQQNLQTIATAVNTVAASAAASFSNVLNKMTTPNLQNVIPPVKQQQQPNNLTNPVQTNVIPQNESPLAKNPVTATPTNAPVITQTTTANLNVPTATSSLSSAPVIPIMPKSTYDSLAPLDLPSKPIIYVTEPTNGDQTDKSDQDSRMDEKAKLESILLTQMKPGADNMSMPVGGGSRYPIIRPGMGPNQAGSSWPRMPMMMNQGGLPANYRCIICKKPGHHKNQCPEAGMIPRVQEERLKFPSGIPKSTLKPAQPGDKFAMLGPNGYVVSEIAFNAAQNVKKDKPLWQDDEEEELTLKEQQKQSQAQDALSKIPADLKCPFGDHIIKDAVLVPCCGHFVCCDECIRQKISNDENIECPYEKCDQEIGSLSSITPFHETRKKVNDYLLKMQNLKSSQQSNVTIAASTASTYDPLLDSMMSDIDKPMIQQQHQQINKLSPIENLVKTDKSSSEPTQPKLESGIESPLQDNKISSSAPKTESPDTGTLAKPFLQPHLDLQAPLLPSPPLSNTSNIPSDPTKTGLIPQIALNQPPHSNVAVVPPVISQQQHGIPPQIRPPMPFQQAQPQNMNQPPFIQSFNQFQPRHGPFMRPPMNMRPQIGGQNIYPSCMGSMMPNQPMMRTPNMPGAPINQPQPQQQFPNQCNMNRPPHFMNQFNNTPLQAPISNQIMGGVGPMGLPVRTGPMNQFGQPQQSGPFPMAGQNINPAIGGPAPPHYHQMPNMMMNNGGVLGPMGNQMPIQQNNPLAALQNNPILSEREFYEYQERMRKESELKNRQNVRPYDNRHRNDGGGSGKTCDSSSRRRGSRSRSRTRSYTKSRSYSRSRSRSPSKRGDNKSSKHSRKYRNRSRTRSRSRSTDRYKKSSSSKYSGDYKDTKTSSSGRRKNSRSRTRSRSKDSRDHRKTSPKPQKKVENSGSNTQISKDQTSSKRSKSRSPSKQASNIAETNPKSKSRSLSRTKEAENNKTTQSKESKSKDKSSSSKSSKSDKKDKKEKKYKKDKEPKKIGEKRPSSSMMQPVPEEGNEAASDEKSDKQQQIISEESKESASKKKKLDDNTLENSESIKEDDKSEVKKEKKSSSKDKEKKKHKKSKKEKKHKHKRRSSSKEKSP